MDFSKSFPVLRNNSKLIYFDNAATFLKPDRVIESEIEYLTQIGANPHTNDFKNATLANDLLWSVRQKTMNFLHAKEPQEIIFNSGTTEGLNQIAFGLRNHLQKDDEIVLTTLEHSANLLPWIVVAQQVGTKIKTFPLTLQKTIDLNQIKKVINSKTKIVSFAHASNTIGALNDVQKIVQMIRSINSQVFIVLDVAQTVAHYPIDVQAWDADFVVFSAHKMYGPFGLGILWGKKTCLNLLTPFLYGGDMSLEIADNFKDYRLANLPNRLEAGTPNIPAIAGFSAALDFLNEVGWQKIQKHEQSLKKYLVKQIKKLDLTKEIDFYNLDNESPLLVFNSKKWSSQDVAHFLDYKYGIAVRSGAHCARLTKLVFGTSYSVRASFAIYNTIAEIDIFLDALQHLDDFLDVFFEKES